MTAACGVQTETLQAFDMLAPNYDDLFTRSTIGRAQRGAVWNVLTNLFEPGARILELNCGTGEDALFLAAHDVSVVACDGSPAMIQTARERMRHENPDAPIHFLALPTEHLARLHPRTRFDGALSNFSGLNCVADLRPVACDLARLVAVGAPVVLCLSTRFCLLEMLWYLSQGNVRKAFRRVTGTTTARVGQFAVKVYYPTLREIMRSFSPWFRLHACTGIGVTVPPSYVEPILCRWPRLLACLQSIDSKIAHLPLLRNLGDHMLLHFERVEDPCP